MARDSSGVTSSHVQIDAQQLRHRTAESDRPKAVIIDIRKDREGLDLLKGIQSGLRPAHGGKKSLPTLLLYDEAGLKLYEKLTYLPEYYLIDAEIEVLEHYAKNIAERIQPNSIVLELGSGSLRKTEILLKAFENAAKPIEYYALDVSLNELERTLSAVPPGTYKYVKCFGLHGTYDDGFDWIRSEYAAARTKAILSIGSSIGNFARPDAARFLENCAAHLQPGDKLLIGIDGCKDPEKIFTAYNDPHGLTHNFVLNGLQHANRLLGTQDFNLKDWRVHGAYNSKLGGHEAHVYPVKDAIVDGVLIKTDERIWIEQSLKYDDLERERLWKAAGLVEGARWANKDATYGLYMAYKPSFDFPLTPELYAASPVPSLQEWDSLWAAWDAVTQRMITKEELLTKPIKLRNACIFYLGHIPTFLAIHLDKAGQHDIKGLNAYKRIFERGIDPDVDNPELCHAHSEIPDEWPPEVEILDFQAKVRQHVRAIYSASERDMNHPVKKALWIGFEHEVMHLETLLYMLVQSEKTLPPPGSVIPDFKAMAKAAAAKALPNKWIDVPARTVSLGLNDDDNDETSWRYFGWDNEKPARTTKVRAFSVKARPITNGEYLTYLDAAQIDKLPASWVHTPIQNDVKDHADGVRTNGVMDDACHQDKLAGGKAVRTVFGLVPLKYALDWPVMASYDELLGFAEFHQGRIPTMEEVKSIYEYAEELKAKDVENSLGKTIPAVNGHLNKNGVEETPPHKPLVNGASGTVTDPNPRDLFIDLEGANVGFKHWHPTPVTQHGDKLLGQSELGGVWEWTSTVLEKHDGFAPMELYPGYTNDFFDGKHNIVLGGSWATHPRIAGRKSFVNWYQRNYPYVWAGARLAKAI